MECDLVDVPQEPRHECDGVPDFLLTRSNESCSEYFVCYNNEKLLSLTCPENQVFDEDTQVCGDEFECSL